MQTPHQETWLLTSLNSIGGYPIEINGHPKIIPEAQGSAIAFNGIDDSLLIQGNPLLFAPAFTVEVILKPGAGINITNDPRFLHLADPADPQAKRLMVEIRVNPQGQWSLDAMLKTDAGERALLDLSITHPTDQWAHAAVTYDGTTLRTYVNGQLELAGPISHLTTILAPTAITSLGSRMNKVHWLLGSIKLLRFTHAALEPKAFLSY